MSRSAAGAVATAAACMAMMLAACSHEEAARKGPAAAPVAAEIAQARAEEVPDVLTLTGTIQPTSRVIVASKVMGRIERIAVREGEAVRERRLLVKIDDADLRAAAAQAEAALEAASAAEANAAAHRDRMRDLESRQAATRKNREDAETAASVAAAQRRQAESALAGARAMLAHATILSPVTGVVTAKHAEEGSMAAPGAPLLTIEETARFKVEAALPETEWSYVRAGTPVTVSFDAGGLPPRRAAVSEILPAADPATRTLLLRVVLDGSEELRSGMFARVAVERGTRRAIRIPRSAVLERGALTGVFVAAQEASGATARLRWVRLGSGDAEAVEVLGGLAEGERYVARPPAGLGDGAPLAGAR